uniref:CAB/ELIP/HLIP superfamily protein n=1 Tax=Sporolithon durum TaxID=48970 RepID=A0A141SD35_9FLOR|nr:CAB/ELIP/HLIP superfamily protein [Sporolithon durum]AMK96203.1 CAB/ELIP/HLIP superfamily protein [Sporolithon durum]
MNNDLRNRWIWGFTQGAENWNGRLAMLAFLFIVLFELFSSTPVLSLFIFFDLYKLYG